MKDKISLSYCLRATIFISVILMFYVIYKLGTGLRILRRAVTAIGPLPGIRRIRPLRLNKLAK